MIFWNTKHLLRILFLGSSGHVFIGMRVEEERVRSPREGFGTNVEVFVVGREREVTIILRPEVFLVLCMFSFNLLHPKVTSRDCGETAIEANLAPEVRGVFGMMYYGFAFYGPVFRSGINDDGTGRAGGRTPGSATRDSKEGHLLGYDS